MGPLIHAAARKKVERYVDIGREEGAELVVGGGTPRGKQFAHGWFHAPTIFAGVRAGSRLEQEEIFGPVLSVVRIGSLEEAIRVNNGVRYGLSSSLYTRDTHAAFRAMQDLDNGITYINAPTIGAEAHLPFGGVKQTGNGHREGWLGGISVLFRDESGLRRLLGKPAAGTDRQLRLTPALRRYFGEGKVP